MTGKDIIKKWEGLRLNAYLCPAGVHKLNTDYGSDQSGKDWADWITRADNDDPNKTLKFLRDYVKDVPF